MARILVADDTASIRELLKRLFELHGHCVTTARNGAEALTLALSLPHDLILLDMNMPVMTGWEAALHIRATSRNRSVPMIAITGHGALDDEDYCRASGCSDIVVKPFDVQELLQKVVHHLAPGDYRSSQSTHVR